MVRKSGQGRIMVKNGVSGLLASGLGGIIQFATLLLIIRMLPVAEFGRFSVLLSFGLVVQFIADFGLSSIFVKEFSAKPEEERSLRGKAQALVWCISLLLLLLASLVILGLYSTWEHRSQAFLMALMGVFLFQSAGYTAILRAREEMEWNAYGHILHKVVLLGGICLVAHQGAGLWGVIHAHVLSGLILLLFYAATVAWRYGLVKVSWDPGYWKYLFRRSIPLGSGLFLRQFSWQVDVFILTLLCSDYVVGLFSAPYRIFAACLLIAQVMALPVFPLMSRLAAAKDQEGFQRLYDTSLRMLFLLGIPIAALVWTFSELIVTQFLGGAYSETTEVIRLLALAFPLIFSASLFPFVFTSLDRQLTFVSLSALGLLLRIGLAFALIPLLGFVGACYAVLCSEAAVTALWVIALWRRGLRMDVNRLLGMGIIGLPMMILIMSSLGASQSWYQAILGVGTAVAFFAALLWWGRGLSQAERDLVIKLWHRLLPSKREAS